MAGSESGPGDATNVHRVGAPAGDSGPKTMIPDRQPVGTPAFPCFSRCPIRSRFPPPSVRISCARRCRRSPSAPPVPAKIDRFIRAGGPAAALECERFPVKFKPFKADGQDVAEILPPGLHRREPLVDLARP